MRIRTWMLAFSSMLAVSACRRPPPVVVQATPALVPAGVLPPPGLGSPAPVVFDATAFRGLYRGQSVLVRDGGGCRATSRVAVSIPYNEVRFRVDRSVPEVIAPITLDGTFAADNGLANISGRFVPGQMVFDAGTPRCGYRYILTRG